MANRRFTQFFYTPHIMPVLLDCNFVIDKANGNGLGIRNLKGPAIQAVYGNTSATPAVGNPNPAAGYFVVQFANSYNRYFGGFSGFVAQTSGSNILIASAGVTAGTTYVIVLVGTTTAAGWQSLGLPVGITPAVGVSFVATASTTATGTGVVQVPNANGSGITQLEVVGDPNTTINSVGIGSQFPYMIVRSMAATNSSTTTLIATAPADNSVLGMSFYLGNSSASAGSAG